LRRGIGDATISVPMETSVHDREPRFPGPFLPRLMTRCECAGVSFEEVARLVRKEGLSLEAARRRVGVGDLCTACLPDLEATVRSR